MKRLSNLKINAKGKRIVEYAILVSFVAILTITVIFIIIKLINSNYFDKNLKEPITNLNNLYYSYSKI